MLQQSEKLFDDVQPFNVSTKYGRARIKASKVSGHRIIVVREPHTYHSVTGDKGKDITIAIGFGLMYHGEQGQYQIFPGGMYDMGKARTHAVRGERHDDKVVHKARQRTFDFVGRLRTMVLLPDEARLFTDATLEKLANEFDEPKRNKRKLAAARNFRKASKIRTSTEVHRPMPAAMTASAGAHHLDKRREEVRTIVKEFLDPERREVFDLIAGVHARLDDAWRVFRPAAFSEPGNVIMLVCEKPDGRVKRVVRDQLRPVCMGLKEIQVRPLNGLARIAADEIVKLVGRMEAFVRKDGEAALDLTPEIDRIRHALATMLLIRQLEMEVIMPLSFLLGRWKRLDAGQQEEVVILIRGRAKQFEGYVEMNIDHFPEMHQKYLRRNASAIALLLRDDKMKPRKLLLAAKRELKSFSNDASLSIMP